MLRFAVLAEALAVVGGRDHQRVPGLRVDRGVEVRLRIFKYSKREAKRELDSLTDYWLGKREPKPATTPGKCEICLYNAAGLCSVALSPYRR